MGRKIGDEVGTTVRRWDKGRVKTAWRESGGGWGSAGLAVPETLVDNAESSILRMRRGVGLHWNGAG